MTPFLSAMPRLRSSGSQGQGFLAFRTLVLLSQGRSDFDTEVKRLRFRFWKKKPNPILQKALQDIDKEATRRDLDFENKCPKCGGTNFKYLSLYNLWECQSFLGNSLQRCGELLGIQTAPDWKELNGSKTGFCPFCGSADVYHRTDDWCCKHCLKAFPWPSHLNKPLPPNDSERDVKG